MKKFILLLSIYCCFNCHAQTKIFEDFFPAPTIALKSKLLSSGEIAITTYLGSHPILRIYDHHGNLNNEYALTIVGNNVSQAIYEIGLYSLLIPFGNTQVLLVDRKNDVVAEIVELRDTSAQRSKIRASVMVKNECYFLVRNGYENINGDYTYIESEYKIEFPNLEISPIQNVIKPIGSFWEYFTTSDKILFFDCEEGKSILTKTDFELNILERDTLDYCFEKMFYYSENEIYFLKTSIDIHLPDTSTIYKMSNDSISIFQKIISDYEYIEAFTKANNNSFYHTQITFDHSFPPLPIVTISLKNSDSSGIVKQELILNSDYSSTDKLIQYDNKLYVIGSANEYVSDVRNQYEKAFICGFELDFPSSTNEITPKHEFIITPNPSSHEITIQSEQPFSLINIYSLTGKLIERVVSPSINISAYNSGVYLLECRFQDGSKTTKRFVKN